MTMIQNKGEQLDATVIEFLEHREFTIQTYSGIQFSPKEVTVDMFDPIDVAHGLSHICRFSGQSKQFYSVAEHCVLVSKELKRRYPKNYQLQLEGLLHDATEAYLLDIPSPFKAMYKGYKELEIKCEKIMAKAFGINFPFNPLVKKVDKAILLDENQQLMRRQFHPNRIDSDVIPLGIKIPCWGPKKAKKEWLNRYYELKAKLK